MITRQTGYLTVSHDPVPEAARELERDGYTILEGVFDPDEVARLATDIDRVYDQWPPDVRVKNQPEGHYDPFRYEMVNRSDVCQEAIAHPAILSVVEPLLGEDCHVIANTAWRQEAGNRDHGGRFWHIDSGPHVPRPAGVPWDERIPYPVFVVAAHLMVRDCPLEAGPTGVIPGSHRSGQAPPYCEDDDLTYDGQGSVALVASAGDVALFVSDTWHRRMPSGPGDPGRYFLQCHYGRRDLAPRLRTSRDANQLSDDAVARARTRRERQLVGLHRPGFYDA